MRRPVETAQDCAVQVRHIERVGIRFRDEVEATPIVHVLRDGFPETGHQLLVHEDAPTAICIDDRPWPEARLTWTPAELLHRIGAWFERAATGGLDDASQPLDPNLLRTGIEFVVRRAHLRNAQTLRLVAIPGGAGFGFHVVPLEELGSGKLDARQALPLSVISHSVPPERMTRMSSLPRTLPELAGLLSARGCDLWASLREQFRDAVGDAANRGWRINARLVVVVEMTIIGGRGAGLASDVRAFMTNRGLGDIAVALGEAVKSDDHESEVGYSQAIPRGANDDAALEAIEVLPAEVHVEFDRALATRLSDRAEIDERRVVLVGAGAIGSHVATSLVRQGRFRWTVIDHDMLAPHNIARHTGAGSDVLQFKSEILARTLTDILDDPGMASAIPANALDPGDWEAEVERARQEADIVIDATASVRVARHLSDHPGQSRHASVFFNPAGNAAVLLIEPADRTITLRDLEAQHLARAAQEAALDGHFAPPDGIYAYSGGCQAITNVIPQWKVATLSGLVSGGVGAALDEDGGAIRVWSLGPAGDVKAKRFDAAPVRRWRAKGWTVTVDGDLEGRLATMRCSSLPNETGGVLLGAVDLPARSIHVAAGAPPPADSIATPDGFVRGRQGVEGCLAAASDRTLGQLRYVGGWHSHPPGASAAPSPTDLVQLDWLAATLGMEALPGLMLIAAEDGVEVMFGGAEGVPQTPHAPGGSPRGAVAE